MAKRKRNKDSGVVKIATIVLIQFSSSVGLTSVIVYKQLVKGKVPVLH
jgi:hypothetical protein